METERLIFTQKRIKGILFLFADAAVMKHLGDDVMTREQAEVFWLKLFEKLYRKTTKFGRFLRKKIRAMSDTREFTRARRAK